MESKDVELIKKIVCACVQGTPVSVYDNDGYICSFKLEDVIDVRAAENERRLVYIALRTPAVTIDEEGNSIPVNPVIVYGTKTQWSKRLGIKPTILNDAD